MIEIPEAHVLVEQLNRTVRRKRVVSAEANHTPHGFAWYTGDPAGYNEKLAGKAVAGAETFNGSVKMTAKDMTLLISTPIKYHEPGEPLPQKHQLAVRFEDGSSISCTVQMWGAMFCYKTGDELHGLPSEFVYKTAPTPLEDGFDRAYFDELVAREMPRNLPAKAFLATEQRIPGLGNGVLQDVLWTAKIHPKRKMATLSDGNLTAMFEAVKSVIGRMAAEGGRDTETDLFGRKGGYRTVLSKNTAGKPCPVCGGIIKKEAYLGGAIYYCEGCQQL